MKLNEFETYCLFVSLRQHFTKETYDYFKYKGKVKTSLNSFTSRRDRFMFQKLSKLHNAETLCDFIVANIVCGKTWIGDFLDDEAEDNYKKFLKINQALSYHFQNELDNIFSEYAPKHSFKVQKNSYPPILMMYMSGRVSIQTMIVLDNFIRYTSRWNQTYHDDPIWVKHHLLFMKYAPFLKYDKDKMKKILKDKIKEYEHGEEQEAHAA
jgi:hypothetical protein